MCSHRVVFIDDGHRAHIQQGLQGAARIQIASALFCVTKGQKNLGGFQPLIGETILPALRQRDLSNGGGGLALLQCQCLAVEACAGTAKRHRAGCHDHYLLAARAGGFNLFGQPRQPLLIQRAIANKQ